MTVEVDEAQNSKIPKLVLSEEWALASNLGARAAH